MELKDKILALAKEAEAQNQNYVSSVLYALAGAMLGGLTDLQELSQIATDFSKRSIQRIRAKFN